MINQIGGTLFLLVLLFHLSCATNDDDGDSGPNLGLVDSQAEFTFNGQTNTFNGVGTFGIGDTTFTVQSSTSQDSVVVYGSLIASITRYEEQNPVEGLTFTIANYMGPGVYDLSTQSENLINLISYNDLSVTPSRSCISRFTSDHSIVITSENETTLTGTLNGICTGNGGDFTGNFTVRN